MTKRIYFTRNKEHVTLNENHQVCHYQNFNPQSASSYNVCLETGSDQLIVTLYALSIYPSVHNQLIRTLSEAHIVHYQLLFQSYI